MISRITRTYFVKRFAVVTGVTRSCKQMLAPIVSSFEAAEHVTMNYLLEQLVETWKLGRLEDDVAANLLRFGIDNMCYNISIGRNLNFRLADYTSIWRSSKVWHNVRKIWSSEGDAAFEQIGNTSPIYVMMAHNALWQSPLYFAALPNMTMFNVLRHPVDIVHSWYKKKYDGTFHANPRNATLTIDWRGQPLVYYAAGWEEKYLGLGPVDRMIFTINYLESSSIKQYEGLPEEHRRNVHLVYVDRLLRNPEEDLDILCKMLGTKQTSATIKVLKQERCPRDFEKGRAEKYELICAKASPEGRGLLDLMIREYEGRRFSPALRAKA
jgi:hypothetical protein